MRGGQGPRPHWDQWFIFIILVFILKAMGNHRRVLKPEVALAGSCVKKMSVVRSSVKNGLQEGKAGSQTGQGMVAGGQVRDEGG